MHRAAQTVYLFRCHAAGNVEREDDRQRPRLAVLVFHVEESEWLLDAVLEEFEIFLLQTAHSSSLEIGDGGVHGNEISIDAQDVVRFFLFFGWVDLPWSLLRCWRGVLRRHRHNVKRNKKHSKPGTLNKSSWKSVRQMSRPLSLCILSVLCVSEVSEFCR